VEKILVINLSEALHYIEKAYEELNYYILNEDSLNDSKREKFYSYGRDKLRLNIVRLVNIKKSINAIIGNKRKEIE